MELKAKQKDKFLLNLLRYTAPILAIFFAQLAAGVDIKAAAMVAVFALYAAISDFMSKVK